MSQRPKFGKERETNRGEKESKLKNIYISRQVLMIVIRGGGKM